MRSFTELEVLEIIRHEASTDFQDYIPEPSRQNIAEVRARLQTLPPNLINELTGLLVKLIEQYTYFNPYTTNTGVFEGAYVSAGGYFEEYYPITIKGEQQTPTSTAEALIAPKYTPMIATYHWRKTSIKYKDTLSSKFFKDSVSSTSGLSKLQNVIYGRMVDRIETDIELIRKQILGQIIADSVCYEVNDILDEESAKQFALVVNKASSDMKWNTNRFHRVESSTGVYREDIFVHTPVADQQLVLLEDVNINLKVHKSEIFNQGNLTLPNFRRTVELQDFGTYTADGFILYGFISDYRLYEDNLVWSSNHQFFNPDTEHTNLFSHRDRIHRMSPFVNCICLVKAVTEEARQKVLKAKVNGEDLRVKFKFDLPTELPSGAKIEYSTLSEEGASKEISINVDREIERKNMLDELSTIEIEEV